MNSAKEATAGAREWLARQLSQTGHSELTRIRLGVICAAIFLTAVGVRILHWQDKHVDIVSGKAALAGVFNRYEKEATRMLDSGGILFPRERPVDGDARMLVHPPGYSILLAVINRLGGHPHTWLWILQIVCDAAAAVLVFLIASQLLNWRVALIAGLLVALSPHLAYYSLILSPDSLAVVPLLIAMYFFVRALRRPRLMTVVAAGAFVGLSCWLRANALLLAPFLAVATVAVFSRPYRIRYAAALLGAAILIIAPITIRNLIVFKHFIPVSIAAGENLVVGIGDYDTEQRFGMPRSDREARLKDAEWNNRPDYGASLWTPDGIHRDRVRFARGVDVVRSNPGWFLGVMLRRAGFMLRYNDPGAHRWPLNTAVVQVISSEAPFGHPVNTSTDTDAEGSPNPSVLVLDGSVIPGAVALTGNNLPAWSSTSQELVTNGALISKTGAAVSLESESLRLEGDVSEYGDQFESAMIPVKRDTDYVLVTEVRLRQGDMALKITSSDRRISRAVAAVSGVEAELKDQVAKDAAGDSDRTGTMIATQMPFTSAKNNDVRLVISNNNAGSSRPVIEIGQVQLFEVGPTPYAATRLPRGILRSLQRNIFTTSRLLPIVILGVVLLLIARRWTILATLLVVPVYYLCAQAALSTEYRYILGIHYFLFVIAGAGLYCLGSAVVDVSKLVSGRFTRH